MDHCFLKGGRGRQVPKKIPAQEKTLKKKLCKVKQEIAKKKYMAQIEKQKTLVQPEVGKKFLQCLGKLSNPPSNFTGRSL